MTLATAAMAVWGATVVALDYVPARVPDFWIVFSAAALFALPGFLLGLLTLRARRSWFLLALVPLCANGMLIVLPLLVHHWRAA